MTRIFKDEEPTAPVIKRGGLAHTVGGKIIGVTTLGLSLLFNGAWQLYAYGNGLNDTHPLFYLVSTFGLGLLFTAIAFFVGVQGSKVYNMFKWRNEELAEIKRRTLDGEPLE